MKEKGKEDGERWDGEKDKGGRMKERGGRVEIERTVSSLSFSIAPPPFHFCSYVILPNTF